MFQKALTLMSQRCTSDVTSRHQQVYEHLYHSQQLPGGTNKVTNLQGKQQRLDAGGNPPLGKYTPSLFYINQVKPSPMPPLKAWRGFTGNVYFEPIKVKSMSNSAGGVIGLSTATKSQIPPGVDTPLVNKTTRSRHKRISTSEPGAALSDGSVDGSSNEAGYAHSTPAGPALKHHTKNYSKRDAFKTRPNKTVLLDKSSAYNNNLNGVPNPAMSEDSDWTVGQQHPVGSLCIASPTQPKESKDIKQPSKSKKVTYNKEKICRGSVAHKVFVTSQDKKGDMGGGAELTTKPVKTPATPAENDNENKGNLSTDKTGKLPPLDTSRSAKSQAESSSGGLELMKGSTHPLPKDKPYVKYSRDAFKQ